MDYLRRAEILIYLLLTVPRTFLRDESESQLRQWCLQTLQRLAVDSNDEDLSEIADYFAAFTLRLQRSLGVKVDDEGSLTFQTNLGFSAETGAIDNLFAERQRLISRLEYLNELLQISTDSPLIDLSVSRMSSREAEQDPRTTKAHSDVARYLSYPGPNALDNQTFARLLSRDTGA